MRYSGVTEISDNKLQYKTIVTIILIENRGIDQRNRGTRNKPSQLHTCGS